MKTPRKITLQALKQFCDRQALTATDRQARNYFLDRGGKISTMLEQGDQYKGKPFVKGCSYNGFGKDYGTTTMAEYHYTGEGLVNYAIVRFELDGTIEVVAFQWDCDHWNEVEWQAAVEAIYYSKK